MLAHLVKSPFSPEAPLDGKDVLIVEDIIDSGRTLSYLLRILKGRHPASIRLCTLLDKPERRVTDVEVDYCCFNIPDEFLVGYGLDYATISRRYRPILPECLLTWLNLLSVLKLHWTGKMF